MSNVTSLLGAKASWIAEQADALGHQAAGNLHAAAASIRKGGKQGSEAIEELAENTATRFDQAGSFVEEHDLKHAMGESRQLVRRYPVESLVLAAGVGFLTGFAARRLAHSCAKTAPGASK